MILKHQIILIFLLIISCSIYFSCQPDGKTDNPQDIMELQTKGYVSFSLDDRSGKYHFSLQAFNLSPDSAYFSFFNQLNSTLYVYNYDNQELEQRIVFENEGANGVGNPGKIGHLIVSLDSIFLYNASNFKLMLANSNGKILKRISVRTNDAGVYTPFADVRTLKPMVYKDNKVYLTGLKVGVEPIPDHTKFNNVIAVHLEQDEIEYPGLLRRSKTYNEGQWGALHYYQLYPCYNPNTGRFVYSFGIDHNVYETDHDDYIQPYMANSRYFDKKIKPLAKDKDLSMAELPVNKRTEYDFTTPSYYAILYDESRNLYYRFVSPALTKEEYREKKPLSPVVMILDENFEILGETSLPSQGTYNYSMMFVNENGLHIMHDNGEEGKLYFVIFEPVKIEQI